MRLAGKVYKVRFLVFYVSKLALVESFKAMNNIDQLESINDLHISLYELRRTNRRDRHRKEQDQLER